MTDPAATAEESAALAASTTLVQDFEGFSNNAYQDVVGVWTIGFGRTGPDVVEGQTTTRSAELAWLAGRLERNLRTVSALVEKNLRELRSSQWAALVSLSYNIGLGAFARSTVCRLVKAGTLEETVLKPAWLAWAKAGGKEVLLARRTREYAIFSETESQS